MIANQWTRCSVGAGSCIAAPQIAAAVAADTNSMPQYQNYCYLKLLDEYCCCCLDCFQRIVVVAVGKYCVVAGEDGKALVAGNLMLMVIMATGLFELELCEDN